MISLLLPVPGGAPRGEGGGRALQEAKDPAAAGAAAAAAVRMEVAVLMLPERDEVRDGCCITKDLLLPFSSSPFFPPCSPPLLPLFPSLWPYTLHSRRSKKPVVALPRNNEVTAGDEPAERMREQKADRPERERDEREREREGKRVV